MKLVHIAVGKTFTVKEKLREFGFKWLPDDKVWVRWIDPEQDGLNIHINETINRWDNVVCLTHLHDPFVRTCVDPLHINGSTGSNYDWKSELSEIDKNKIKHINKVNETNETNEKHDWVGKAAELNKFASKTIQEKINENRDEPITYLYRNVTIKEVLRETAKAILINVELFGGIGRSCHVCGSKLDTEISRSCGVGPVCAKNLGLPRPNKNNASIILSQIEELANKIGEVGPIWIPKSCISINHN